MNCKTIYVVTDEDRKFYEKLGFVLAGKKYPVSVPKLCPSCREQRRLAIRNERVLYPRTSSLSGKKIISFHAPDTPFKVYSHDEWFSDKWDAMEFGRDFDSSRPFFDQFSELREQVPRMNTNLWQSENCDYCTFTDFSQNCYLVFGASNCRDTYYSNLVDSVLDCCDVSGCKSCERCYDCIDCVNCNNLIGSSKCEASHDCAFCFDCKSCDSCIFCFNLSHKKYCIYNKQYSREEYSGKIKEFNTGNFSAYESYKKKFLEMCKTQAIHRYAKIVNCEGSNGDNLTNSKNAVSCYESNNLQDCKYVQFSMNSRDAYDVVGSSNKGCELSCEAMSIEGQRIFSGYYIAGLHDVYYCDSVLSCKNIFGCVGVKHKEYCILNKQYSKTEYEELFARIIQHMQRTAEWGEFFPIRISPFAYNETVAQDYFPMIREDARKRGYQWREEARSKTSAPTNEVPDDIKDITEEILNKAVCCKTCAKVFRLIPHELALYKSLNVPAPKFCPDCRHRARLLLRNPRQLFKRHCSKCFELIETTYDEENAAKIYCAKCYLEVVF